MHTRPSDMELSQQYDDIAALKNRIRDIEAERDAAVKHVDTVRDLYHEALAELERVKALPK